MELEERIASLKANGDKDLGENLVQEILSESLSENDHQSSIFTRLHPSQLPIPNNNNNISILTDHLILTSAASVYPDVIEALDITCVISAAPELPDIPLKNDVTYRKVDIMDRPNSNIFEFLDEAADIIDHIASLGGRTLVFCVAGVSRSASLCIAYLMKHHQLTLLEAYNYIKIRRPRIKPNCGFFKQLIDYEKSMFINSTVEMVFNESVQMYIPDVYDSEYKMIRSINRKFKDRYRH